MTVNSNDVGQQSQILANFITRKQLADSLPVSIRTLDRWHAARRGPPRIKQGKLILYRVEAVRLWLQSNETKNLR